MGPRSGPRYDVVVVGSGFGGSVAALRLSEKGYRVLVLEAGRRFEDDDFARSSWDLPRYLWAPWLGWYGVQRLHPLQHVTVVAGAGVGGGSLNYATVLYRPGPAFFTHPQWGQITDWHRELEPHYVQAERMLGRAYSPRPNPCDEVLRRTAQRLGARVQPAAVGVFFGSGDAAPGAQADPYFAGAGPRRTPCTHCGCCLTGCRVGAKNTLVKNYLYLAEQAGAVISSLTTVTAVHPRPDGGWQVHTRSTGPRPGRRQVVHAEQVVLAAGALGSQRLLVRMRDRGVLPLLSAQLGRRTRTNAEAVAYATAGQDISGGVAVTSSAILPGGEHLQLVRYGPGSDALGLLQTPLVDQPRPGLRAVLAACARQPRQLLRLLAVRGWAARGAMVLMMADRDDSLRLRGRTGPFGLGWHLASGPDQDEHAPAATGPTRWLPQLNAVARVVADVIGGVPAAGWNAAVGSPMTAHLIGGCVIGADADHGVIDAYHRVFGYPTLSVLDGSAVPANLVTNPALTITALAERACSWWPRKGEPDRRPAPGEPYRPVEFTDES